MLARGKDQRTWQALFLLTMALSASVSLAASVIVDNKDAGFTILSGTWQTGSSTTPYPPGTGDYRFASTVTGTATAEAEWRPNLPSTGEYTVSVWYGEGSNRANNAPYTVEYAGGSTTVNVNQQASGGEWFSIGQFTFDAGTSGAVKLNNQAQSSKVVIADAIQFEEVVASYNLSMAVSPAGTGTTTPPVGGPYAHAQNDVVNISAVANDEYAFDHWMVSAGSDVASPTSATTTVTMDQAKTVTAFFVSTRKQLIMAVSPPGAGTTTPRAGGPYARPQNEVISITAAANAGFVFDHWEVSAGSAVAQPASASTSFTMDQSKTVTAVFVCPQPDLSVLVTPPGAGTTTPAEGGPYALSPGQVVGIAATANADFVFDHWSVTAGSGAADPLSASTSITMDQPKTAIAVFKSTLPRTGEVRAFWAVAFQEGYKTQDQVDTMIQAAVDGHYNVIIAQMLAYQDTGASAHGAYWNSSIVPKASDITPADFDPLGYLCTQAHAAGIQVHVMSVPYRMCQVWPPQNNPFLESHPEWFSVSQADMGKIAKVGSIYVLDPGNPEAQDYLLSIMREMLTKYPVDGVHWDLEYAANGYYPTDVNTPNSTLARFKSISGYIGTPDTGYGPWQDFRRRVNTEIVRRAHAEILGLSTPTRQMRQSASLIAYGDIETNFTDSEAYKEFSDWELWTRMGYLDTAIPMNYDREHNTAQKQYFRHAIPQENIWKNNRELVPGLAIYLNYFTGSLAQIQYCREMQTEGTASYDYWYTTTNGTDTIHDPTWFTSPTGVNSLFPAAVPPPTLRWRDPATATEGTIIGRVTDAGTGLGLDDATVQVGGPASSLTCVQTDGNGYYVVAMANATAIGTAYPITVSKSGYQPATHAGVQIVAGQVRQDDLALAASPILGRVTLSSAPPEGGVATQVGSGGLLEAGTPVTVTATPNPGYNFVNWTEKGAVVSTAANYSFTLRGDRALVADFALQPLAARPILSPAGGTFTGSVQVVLTCTTSGATIRYTTDGSDPTADSTPYAGALSLKESATLKARAFAPGYRPSNISSAVFTVNPACTVALSASPPAGGTVRGQGVYAKGMPVTVQATAKRPYLFVNWTEAGTEVSTSASYTFTIAGNRTLVANFAPPAPNYTVTTTASPATGGQVSGGGRFAGGKSVTVTATPNPGYHFLNWTENGAEISADASFSFLVSKDTTLIANFSARQIAATPLISPVGGTHTGPVQVILSCATPQATIRYTTDGTDPADPTGGSTLYTGPFNLTASATLKARAFADGFDDSAVATAVFTITSSGGGPAPVTYRLTLVLPDGRSVPGDYAAGSSITVSAPQAPAGQRFSFWSGAASGSDNPITVVMDADKTLVPNYEPIPAAAQEDSPDASSSARSPLCGAGVPLFALTTMLVLGLTRAKPRR